MNDTTKTEWDHECEEHSFCNCENNEQITPYLRDDCHCVDHAVEAVAEKCHQIKDACTDELKQMTRYKRNPYFKQSWIFQTDIYKCINDENPCDRIVMKNSYTVSLRTLALIGGGLGAFLLLRKLLSGNDEA